MRTVRPTSRPTSTQKPFKLHPTINKNARTQFRTENQTKINPEKEEEKPNKFKSREIGGKLVSVHTSTNNKGDQETVLPLGIACIMNGVPGCMSVLVKPKTSLKNSISETQIYSTHYDNQTQCSIRVCFKREN